MNKTVLLFSFIILFFLAGCKADVTTVQIVRNPTMQFNFNATSFWKAGSYSFAKVSQVVVYPQDTTKPGQLYNRLTLQASGKDDLNNTLQFIISFDASDLAQLVGTYSTEYSTQKGLAEVRLFNLTDNNNLSAYNLCNNNVTAGFLQIQKQNPDEKLLTGIFQMTLCNSRDTTEKINIFNGILTDVRY